MLRFKILSKLLIIAAAIAITICLSIIYKNGNKNINKIRRNHQNLLIRVNELEKQINSQSIVLSLLTNEPVPIEKISQLDFIDQKTLLMGEQNMKSHKAVFVGISRDNVEAILPLVRHIEKIGDKFQDYRVIIFENDSTDGTKNIFRTWVNVNSKVKLISEDFHNKKRPSIEFLAFLRNKYLEAVSSDEYKDFDIIIPIDMDMKYGIDMRGILHSFSMIDQWDMSCSNGISSSKGDMYDAFAFRSKNFPYSPQEYYELNKNVNKTYWDDNIKAIQQIYDPKGSLIPVYSCFGGMAIYKKHLFESCVYSSRNEDCEHVALHKCMMEKHKARLFMNPAQIIRYEHYRDAE